MEVKIEYYVLGLLTISFIFFNIVAYFMGGVNEPRGQVPWLTFEAGPRDLSPWHTRGISSHSCFKSDSLVGIQRVFFYLVQ
jgi:hypothetical protein